MLGPSLHQQGGMASLEKLIAIQKSDEIEIRHISIHEEGSLSHRLQIFAKALGRFIIQLVQGKVDLVHLHVSEGGSVLRNGILMMIARQFDKPVILHTHGSQFHIIHDRLPTWVQRWVAAFFRQSACVITLSESWKAYYTETCNLKSNQAVVLYNPVAIPDQVPDRSDRRSTRFVLLGRIGQRKGAFDLIHAIAQLPQSQQQQIEVYLAGDGELEQAEALIRSLGLQHHVKLLGWIDAELRSQLLSDADVFILPSYNEGLPLSLLEAMAWELPSITTAVGGIPEVANSQTALFVEPGNVEQITTAMQKLIAERDLRLKMGQNARQRVMPLNVEDYLIRLHLIYRQALLSHILETFLFSNSYE
jgi:glycosyltransferase involved in cell wall biosynthesis